MTPNRSWASPRRRARRRGRSSGRPLAPGSARTWSCSGVRRLRTPPPAPLGGSVPGIDARPPQPLLTGWPLCGALWPPAAFGSQRAPHRGSPRRRRRRHTAISAPPLGGSRGLVNAYQWEQHRYEPLRHEDRRSAVGRIVALRRASTGYGRLQTLGYDARYRAGYRNTQAAAEQAIHTDLEQVSETVRPAFGVETPDS
jgi:hypothetical protein